MRLDGSSTREEDGVGGAPSSGRAGARSGRSVCGSWTSLPTVVAGATRKRPGRPCRPRMRDGLFPCLTVDQADRSDMVVDDSRLSMRLLCSITLRRLLTPSLQ